MKAEADASRNPFETRYPMNTTILRKSCFVFLVGLLALSMNACFLSKPEEFSGSGITITLNDSFHEKSSVAVLLYLESLNHLFLGNREAKDDLISYGIRSESDYIEGVLESIDSDSEVLVYEDDDTHFRYAYYTSEVDGETYGYMLVVMEGEDHYYAMNFACFADKLEKNKPTYLDWAKTIRVE